MKIVSKFFICLAVVTLFFSCGNSASSKKRNSSKGVISSGMMAGFPDSQKVATDTSGNWEVAFFKDEFNNKTSWPYLQTINSLDVTCENVTTEGNKPTKSDIDKLDLRFSFTKNGDPCLTFLGAYLSGELISSYTIPVNIITGESQNHYIVYAHHSVNSKHSISINEKEDVIKIINSLLSDDEVMIQLKRKSSGMYYDPYDKIFSIVVGKEGMRQAYNEFIDRQREWEKTLNNN